ncbi:hypothetical protein [Algoriphagus sp.]|uniref:hypothetical protein n=1 Tax=Algoriphagus sp. TaxID=1872435 RepID=UPI002600FBD4|nr:hypothetical protein [Algoriphagus sp.]
MKYFIIVIFLFSWLPSFSQNKGFPTGAFIRVYNSDGIKIGKGKISSLTESDLILGSEQKSKSIPVKNISIIKTKRSKGHLPLIFGGTGFLIGAGIGADAASNDLLYNSYYDFRGSSIILFGLLTGVGSSALGLIISASKKYEVYEIDGELNKLKEGISEIERGK